MTDPTPASPLGGKVAIVTGGARGIGAATARRLVSDGAQVVIGDVLDDTGRALAEERPREFYYYVNDRDSEGIWTAPPGFQWVSHGNGVWHLAPTVVGTREPRNPSPWLGT